MPFGFFTVWRVYCMTFLIGRNWIRLVLWRCILFLWTIFFIFIKGIYAYLFWLMIWIMFELILKVFFYIVAFFINIFILKVILSYFIGILSNLSGNKLILWKILVMIWSIFLIILIVLIMIWIDIFLVPWLLINIFVLS